MPLLIYEELLFDWVFLFHEKSKSKGKKIFEAIYFCFFRLTENFFR